MEKGRRPPVEGVDFTGSADREPFDVIAHAARNPKY